MTEDSLKFQTRNKSPVRDLLAPKSNCTNTLSKLFSYDEEMVIRLNFYNQNDYRNNLSKSCQNDLFFKFNTIGTEYEKNSTPITQSKSSFKKQPDFSLNENSPELFLPEIKKRDPKQPKASVVLTNQANLKKMENILNEDIMERETKEFQEKIKQLKSEIRRYITTSLNIQNEIQKLVVELDFLDNFTKYTENNIKLDTLKKKNKTSEDVENFHLALTQAAKVIEKRDQEISSIKNKLISLEETKKENREKIKSCKETMSKLKERLEVVKNKLLLHYHILLNDGRDTRNEGITWIIKAIWNLGSNVIISYMPNFLDEGLINFIFTSAEKDLELGKLMALIEETKNKLRFSLSLKESRRKPTYQEHRIFSTDLKEKKKINFFYLNKPVGKKFNLLDIFKKLIEKHVFHEEIKPDNYKKVETYLNSKQKLDKNTTEILGKINSLELVYNQKKKELQSMKKSQLDRISKEFLVSDYGRRFNTTLRKVVSAIVGEENLSTELMRQARQEKDYFENIKRTQFFNFYENKLQVLKQKLKFE